MKISIIGTRGIPANYGGFETLVNYLTEYCPENIELTVFCSSKYYDEKYSRYNGARLKYLPFDANGPMSVIYDFISIIKSRKYDKILVLGSSVGLFAPFLFSIKEKLITNIGGLDWQRSKWGKITKIYLKLSEKLIIKGSARLVADNLGIYDYLMAEYGLSSQIIEYGGDHVYRVKPEPADINEFPFLKNRYAFAVARIQKDNNIELILSAFMKFNNLKLIFVGNWADSNYGIKLKKEYNNSQNIILLEAIYNQRKLNLLRSNCYIYIHGHSAGGTNPSLVEAMHLSLPILAFSNIYNKNTTQKNALYFQDENTLISLLENTNTVDLLKIGRKMKDMANERYVWKIIAKKYYDIFLSREFNF